MVISNDTSSEFKNVKLHIVSLKEEITKINQGTNYEEEINNLKIVTVGKSS